MKSQTSTRPGAAKQDRCKRSVLRRLVRRFAKWPKRRVRCVLRFILTDDMRNRPKCINQQLRQAGYTSGDRVVVMLESDFQRVADLAHTKLHGPLHALMLFQIHSADMERITSTANATAQTPPDSGTKNL